jgi:hypothetical protein
MATQNASPQAAPVAVTHVQKIGQYLQWGGLGAFLVGGILSLHHYVIGICFLAGGVAYYVGEKLRSS